MDASRFDRLARSFGTGSSRRRLLRLGAVALGLGVAAGPAGEETLAKKKKIKKNEFGCVNVGGKCRGKDNKCCSGICKGKKPKKGEKDKSKCQAHDTGVGCVAGQQSAFCRIGSVLEMGLDSEGMEVPNCTTAAGVPGTCETTTGNAPYCVFTGECFSCSKDTDCEGVCGPQAACVRCVGCDETGGTGCVGPAKNSCLLNGVARER
jgi:hypothetical protein